MMTQSRKWSVGMGLLGLVALLAPWPASAQVVSKHPLLGKAAPVLTLRDTEGVERSLSEYRGRVVVLNFSASWCRASNREAPNLEAGYQAYKDQGVAVLAVVTGERVDPVAKARSFKERHALTLPVLVDEQQQALKDFSVRGYPLYFVLDAKGTVRSVFLGYNAGLLNQAIDEARR